MEHNKLHEKNQIKAEVRRRVKSGEPKQVIQEDISKRFKDKIAIIKQLEGVPSLSMRKKYRWFNVGIFILLLAIFTLDVWAMLRFFFPETFHPGTEESVAAWLLGGLVILNIAIDAVLLIGVALYRLDTYSWISARAIISLLQIIAVQVSFPKAGDPLNYYILGLLVVSLAFGLFMSARLSPHRIPKKIEVTNSEGDKIPKIIYVFPD
jgi:hypothetical protein